MIAYETLVQTIADWKAGVRPTAPTPPPAPVYGAPEPVEEFASGVVDLDDEGGDEYEVEYGEPSSDEPSVDAGGYDQAGYDDGSGAEYERSGTDYSAESGTGYDPVAIDDDDEQR